MEVLVVGNTAYVDDDFCAKAFPGDHLQVVAAHFGGWNIWPQSLAHPQPESVLYDTSSTLGMTDRDIVLRLIDKIGPDRLIFGTDFPMWSHEEELERFLALGFTEAENRRILSDNFKEFMGIE